MEHFSKFLNCEEFVGQLETVKEIDQLKLLQQDCGDEGYVTTEI